MVGFQRVNRLKPDCSSEHHRKGVWESGNISHASHRSLQRRDDSQTSGGPERNACELLFQRTPSRKDTWGSADRHSACILCDASQGASEQVPRESMDFPRLPDGLELNCIQ